MTTWWVAAVVAAVLPEVVLRPENDELLMLA